MLAGLFVYLKLIPNDLLLIALGAVIRGTFTLEPAMSALRNNTIATWENTAATRGGTIAQETRGETETTGSGT